MDTKDIKEQKKITVKTIMAMKKQRTKITALTAYDYSFARLFDSCDIDITLVGDSLGMVTQGHDSTLPVTMEEMIYHTKAVRRGTKNSFLVADMPFMSYHISIEEALTNAGRFIKEGGAEAVKLEGGAVMIDIIEALVDIGIPVLGHIGLTPQYKNMLGGYKVQGKTAIESQTLIEDAKSVEEAGAFAVVLEGMPNDVAKKITSRLRIPTIGIGAGPYCDGQIMVSYDILGLTTNFSPKYVKKFLDGGKLICDAVNTYCDEIRQNKFPIEVDGYKQEKVHLHPVMKTRKSKI